MSLVFNDRIMQWETYTEPAPDLMGNPVCSWLIKNPDPEPKKEGVFFPYDLVFTQAYHTYSEKPGDEIKRQVETHRDALFLEYGIAVQTSVASHGKRGIRVMRTM